MRPLFWLFLPLICLLVVPGRGRADQPVAAMKAEATSPTSRALTAQEISDGWIRLFDGETTFGWKSNQTDINWKVADGVVSADKGSIGLLVTTT